MSEEQKCYAITSGSYSDYTVLAIYTDKALFDGYVALCRAAGQEPDTEEFALNPHAETIRSGTPSWFVKMDWNGDNAEVTPTSPVTECSGPDWSPAWPQLGMMKGRWTASLPARSAEAAVKGVNERRVIAIAGGVPQEREAYYAWLKAQEAAAEPSDG